MQRFLLIALLALVAEPARGAIEGPGTKQFIQSARTSTEIKIDGRLDEAAWREAPVFDAFVQIFPNENTAPTERTEMRVLYDDRNLYVGFICHDSKPDQIVQKLGRRDNPPTSDTIQFSIDSAHDHNTAYTFGVNAGGVQFDSLQFADVNTTADWDAVWDAAVQLRPDGWSAEFLIPLHLLRFPVAPVQTWGFEAQRHLARTHEDIFSVYIPRNAGGRVSQFGNLTGMRALQPRQDVELLPYTALRGVIRPVQDPNPTPRLLDPSLDVGADLAASITSDLRLNATVNPDFGQVEADQLILNLTNQEQFFPEKRPFFTQGMDIFQPVGSEYGFAPQMLFYSRRIGLTTPILAAAKLTGSATPWLDVGALDTVVMGVPMPDESYLDRRFRFHPERPLHLGPNDEFTQTLPIPENYLAIVTRGKVGDNSTVGARLTSAVPMTGPCPGADVLGPLTVAQRAACAARGGNAAALDWKLATPDAAWVLFGQLDASQVVGGAPSILLPDGVQLDRGAAGYGAYVQASKVGGEPFRFDLKYRYASPTLDLNAVGFLPTQNQQYAAATIRYSRPSGMGFFHAFEAKLTGEGNWSTDGRGVDRGKDLILNVAGLLPGYHSLGVEIAYFLPYYDVREVTGTGIPFQRVASGYLALFGATDDSLPFSVSGNAAVGPHIGADAGQDRWGYGGDVTFTFHPENRLETKLEVGFDYTPHGPRWVDADGPGQYVFGDLHSHFLSLTFRQQLVITPRLTLQAYAQLFSDFGNFTNYTTGASTGGSPVNVSDLTPFAYPGDADFHGSALNLNVVLRWEYRLGSTFFLVYTRSQQELPTAPGTPAPVTLLPVNLLKGPATDAFMLKWSYWWNL